MKTITINMVEPTDFKILEQKLDLCQQSLNEVLLLLAKYEKGNFAERSPDTKEVKKTTVLHDGKKFIGIDDESSMPGIQTETKDVKLETLLSPLTTSTAKFICMPIQPNLDQLEISLSVDPLVFSDAVLEHPAIPGLMLSREERLYGGYLEYIDGSGEKQTETIKQRPFRRKWKKPIPMSVSPSDHHFTNLNPALFPRKN